MKKVIKPSDWPKAEKWLEEMKGIGGVKNVSIPRRSIDTVTFATPPTCASVEIDKIRSVFKGTDTVSLEKHVSSAETLIPDEFTRVQSPEMHFLLEAAEGREEIDGYQIVRLLGQGGNNAVFKVRKGGETYILKVPLYAGNYFRDKMGNERRLLSGIHGEITDKLASGKLVNSPNIIKQHTFKEGDLTYIVLELLEKEIETDRKTKDAGKKVSAMDQVFDQIQGNPVRIAVFLWDVLHALEFMHSLNIVHRDVKPQNCMTTHRGSKIAAVLYDFSEGLYLDDESVVRNATLSMTPHYTSRRFIKVIYEDYINKKKDFFKDCPMSDLRSVLKANDYACTAFATAHLLANIPPYTYLSWETKEEVVMPEQKYDPKSAEKPGQKPKSGPARIRHRAVQVTKNALEEVANRATESKPASAADYASAIWNFQGDPLPRDEIRKMAMGKMYLNIIDRLLDSTIADPKITSIRLGHIYELLQREVNQPGLFTEYTAEDVKRLRPAYRR